MSNIAIVGLQWGDEGKGKFVDYFTKDANVVVRFQGGNNAGHTIVINGVSYKLSVLPSGILHEDKIAFIASGVVLNLEALHLEIERIRLSGIKISHDNLKIADNITLIIPLYQKLDLLLESLKGEKKIGTTGRGISFAYQDKVGRRGIRICDLYEPAVLKDRIDSILEFYSPLLEKYDSSFSANDCREEILNFLTKYKDIFEQYLVRPTYLHSLKDAKILFEGAQGAMLDVTYGTYPFVTSSNTLASEIFTGAGYHQNLNKVFGTVKAYSTRVGSGPFPTEDFTEIGERMNSIGAEFGTVTGRKRRCGFLDLVSLKHIVKLSGISDIILTKIDVLNDFPTIKVCVAYNLDGKEIDYWPSKEEEQKRIVPIYKDFTGWPGGYSFKKLSDLPNSLIAYIKFIEDYLGIPVSVLSFGADREDTLNLSSL
jgi:adenylosuccinate synthase